MRQAVGGRAPHRLPLVLNRSDEHRHGRGLRGRDAPEGHGRADAVRLALRAVECRDQLPAGQVPQVHLLDRADRAELVAVRLLRLDLHRLRGERALDRRPP